MFDKNDKNTYKKRAPLPPKILENEIEGMVFGRNPVSELLKSGRTIDKIYMIAEQTGSLPLISTMASQRGIVIVSSDRKKLDIMTGNAVHQGVVATTPAREYSTVEQILAIADDRREKPFIVICDEVEDPHNLGAIIRCADAAGAHGIIIPKRRSAALSATCAKASSGAIEHIAIAKVVNLAAAIDTLKERGVWIYGAVAGGASLHRTDMRGAVGVVLGSEGFGLSALIEKKCDFIVSIGMFGKINSLNVSCAAAVILCEVARQRHEQTSL